MSRWDKSRQLVFCEVKTKRKAQWHVHWAEEQPTLDPCCWPFNIMDHCTSQITQQINTYKIDADATHVHQINKNQLNKRYAQTTVKEKNGRAYNGGLSFAPHHWFSALWPVLCPTALPRAQAEMDRSNETRPMGVEAWKKFSPKGSHCTFFLTSASPPQHKFVRNFFPVLCPF